MLIRIGRCYAGMLEGLILKLGSGLSELKLRKVNVQLFAYRKQSVISLTKDLSEIFSLRDLIILHILLLWVLLEELLCFGVLQLYLVLWLIYKVLALSLTSPQPKITNLGPWLMFMGLARMSLGTTLFIGYIISKFLNMI